jgi:hypothetical protein
MKRFHMPVFVFKYGTVTPYTYDIHTYVDMIKVNIVHIGIAIWYMYIHMYI